MKRFRRLTALTLAVLLLLSALSGCKILDTARAVILKNRNTETSAPAPSENVPPVSVPPVQTAVVNAEPTSPQVVQPSPAPFTSERDRLSAFHVLSKGSIRSSSGGKNTNF